VPVLPGGPPAGAKEMRRGGSISIRARARAGLSRTTWEGFPGARGARATPRDEERVARDVSLDGAGVSLDEHEHPVMKDVHLPAIRTHPAITLPHPHRSRKHPRVRLEHPPEGSAGRSAGSRHPPDGRDERVETRINLLARPESRRVERAHPPVNRPDRLAGRPSRPEPRKESSSAPGARLDGASRRPKRWRRRPDAPVNPVDERVARARTPRSGPEPRTVLVDARGS
jgi:hypothetical protein